MISPREAEGMGWKNLAIKDEGKKNEKWERQKSIGAKLKIWQKSEI